MAADPADVLSAPARLAALRSTALADTPPEEAFDRLTRLAARVLGAPVAFLSLVDERRQFVKSQVGLPGPLAAGREIPLTHSVCKHAVASGEALVIGDTRLEAWMRGNPAVAALGIRAYAGIPLVTRDGYALGTLCVADTVPRRWTDDDLEALRDLASAATAEIDRRRSDAERARAEAELRATAERFRAVVEQSIAAIYVLQDGFLRYVNPRGAEIMGVPQEYFDTPRRMEEFVVEEDLALVQENLRRRLAGEVQSVRYPLRIRRPDGAQVLVEVHGSRVDIDSRPAVVGVALDVTDRVRAEREREAAITARDRFYAMVSHELRTPISGVMLYNDLLLSGVYEDLGAGQREAVERSQRSAKHLLDLINDLLDLSKLEAGKMESRAEEVEVGELVDGAVSAVAPMALDHGCELAVRVERRPVTVMGDARRTRQILLNLLSNAIKFGHGKPVEVWCAPVGGGVAVEVTDHGPGIAPEDVPRIWEDFVQLGGDPGVGTGLGLPIAKRLAELVGGRLDVSSVVGEGSTFRLFLPSGGFSGDAYSRAGAEAGRG